MWLVKANKSTNYDTRVPFLAFAADSYVRDQIFVKLQTSGAFCNRLLNGTSTVGCQCKTSGNLNLFRNQLLANQNGNVGVLTPVKRAEDVRSAIAQLPLLINDLIALVDVADLERFSREELFILTFSNT